MTPYAVTVREKLWNDARLPYIKNSPDKEKLAFLGNGIPFFVKERNPWESL